jgi:hypothetical protein
MSGASQLRVVDRGGASRSQQLEHAVPRRGPVVNGPRPLAPASRSTVGRPAIQLIEIAPVLARRKKAAPVG